MKRFMGYVVALSILAGIYTLCNAAGLTTSTSDMIDYCTGANNSNCIYRLDSVGNVTTLGTLNANSATGTSTINNDIAILGNTFFTPGNIIVSTFTSINPVSTYVTLITSGTANITLSKDASSGLPAISTSTAVSGEYIIVGSTTSATTVTISTGAANGVIGDDALIVISSTKSAVGFIYNASVSQWVEVGKQ